MCRSQSFASTATNLTPYSDSLSLRLPLLKELTLLVTVTRRLIMQKARRHSSLARRTPTGCKRTVSGTISLPCSGCFSPFPHGTSSLSVSQEYLALPDGPGRFRQGFTCPALLRILPNSKFLTCTGLSPSMAYLSRYFHFRIYYSFGSPTTPYLPKQIWFGLFPVRSPLLRESLLFSFPPGT